MGLPSRSSFGVMSAISGMLAKAPGAVGVGGLPGRMGCPEPMTAGW